MIQFFVNSLLLGIGLAMDAFSVSLADGLNEPDMKTGRLCLIAGIFSIFQFAMPMIGWFCVHTIVEYFRIFEPFVPWIALALLGYIGIHMIRESKEAGDEKPAASLNALLVQGVATSIDALSVGFTIASYSFGMAFLSCLIIGIVTFAICIFGLRLGRKAGTKLAGKASILGGSILICIGLEILISSFL